MPVREVRWVRAMVKIRENQKMVQIESMQGMTVGDCRSNIPKFEVLNVVRQAVNWSRVEGGKKKWSGYLPR